MKKTIISVLLVFSSFSVCALENGAQPVDTTASNVSGGDEEINSFLSDLMNEDAALGTVMSDVVKIKRERCDLDMGFMDIKLIATKDTEFKALKDKVEATPSYVKSFEYVNRIKARFGKCD